MLLLLLAVTAAEPPGAALPPLEDCAVYDLIHREHLGARADTDNGIQLRVDPKGTGLAAQLVCPGWRITGPAPSEVIVFDPPAYDRHGGKATVGYMSSSYNHHWDTERATGGHFAVCELTRARLARSGWKLVSCRVQIIS